MSTTLSTPDVELAANLESTELSVENDGDTLLVTNAGAELVVTKVAPVGCTDPKSCPTNWLENPDTGAELDTMVAPVPCTDPKSCASYWLEYPDTGEDVDDTKVAPVGITPKSCDTTWPPNLESVPTKELPKPEPKLPVLPDKKLLPVLPDEKLLPVLSDWKLLPESPWANAAKSKPLSYSPPTCFVIEVIELLTKSLLVIASKACCPPDTTVVP